MKQIINNFKKYRFLLSELIIKDIKLKYRRSYLGILWTLLEPLLTTIVHLFCKCDEELDEIHSL